MNVPHFKKTDCAIAFVKKNFHNPEALPALRKAHAKASKIADGARGENTVLNASASAYREAIEMMQKEKHWRFVWGPLTKNLILIMVLLSCYGCAAGAATAGYSLRARTAEELTIKGRMSIVDEIKDWVEKNFSKK